MLSKAHQKPEAVPVALFIYQTSNTTAQLLQGPEWCQLLERIGDTLMLHLLLHCSIFLPLRNNSFLQVAGPPIHEVGHSGCHQRSARVIQ